MERLIVKRRITGRFLAMIMTVFLSAAMVFTMMPFIGTPVYGEDGGTLNVQTPVLVVTGTGFLDEGAYSTSNVTSERSYSLAELKEMAGDTEYIYSAKKQKDPFTKSYHAVRGIELGALVEGLSGISDRISVIASDGYVSTFMEGAEYHNVPNQVYGVGSLKTAALEDIEPAPGLGETRYWYENFEAENAEEVPAVIGWNYAENESAVPASAGDQDRNLKLFVGQLGGEGYDGPEDMNGPLLNGGSKAAINKVVVGSQITETALTIGEDAYTRADILMMDYADAVYTYESKGASVTDYARGVPMSVLLAGYNDDDVVNFESADGYDVAVSGYTVKQLIDNDYMLAYEMGSSASDLAGIYDPAKGDPTKYGFFRLYGSDENGKPAKMVNKITVTPASGIDFSTSPYKHITNGGQSGEGPYNIDSITGATLTVEGPGVKSSVPVSVRDLEGRNAGAARAVYSDKREGSSVSRMYEGIDIYYILNNMTSGDNGIKLTDNARKVLIKNRNRRTIAEFTLDQIEEAHNTDTPVMVAYGTSLTDGTNARPFVFDNGAGADRDLGNEDGCIKLVYDKNAITGDTNSSYTQFGNMAYIYVAEEEAPGYKHDKSPYQSPEISNYVLTITGDKIGREVNYTVEQLENMVAYDEDGKPDNSGMGYRDEYSLANSNYWYVNEYEGIQLWKLLLKSGLDPALADDDQTIVGSTATDGYAGTDKFTVKQVADPDSFGFYEKNPLDLNDGTYKGNENIRVDNNVETGDKLRVGYPVLVAYGVNGYPYVEKASQEGYLSGLQNDGGPLRVISGKLKYNHANGSNQAKLLDKITVGDNSNHYSTHKYNTNEAYTSLAENSTLEVKVLNGFDADSPVLKSKTYKVGDIEELIYGGVLSKNQLSEAKVKTFYPLTKGSKTFTDLYEGIDLNYFLENIVELPGYKGTITFSDGTNELSLNLEDVAATVNGSDPETGISGLGPVLAYGKNGSPMVLDSTAAGYEGKITLAEGSEYENEITVKNDGGPLAVLFPQTDTEVSGKSMRNVTSITVNLSPDKYSHSDEPYSAYADYAITFKGEGTRLSEPKDIKLSELEGKQTIAFTGDYSFLKSGSTEASQARYRGIDLYKLLTSTSVGLKSNADKVIVTTSDDKSREFTLSEIRKTYMNSVTGETGLPVILAYGAGKAGDEDKEDGIPLVEKDTSEGYVAEYSNAGGPVRLVVGQEDAEDANNGRNMKSVKSIEVTAAEMDSWNHNSSEVFKQYRDETVQLVVNDKDGNSLFDKTYTVGEIEDNADLVERMTATVEQEYTWEGIHFWRWVKQEAGSVSGIDDPVSVTVSAADGYNKDIRTYGVDALENGMLDGGVHVPIIMAYGVGGYPLVIGDKQHSNGEGYDAIAGNNGGPLRLIVHNQQGSSITYVKKIVIVVGDGSTEPEEAADFTIKGLKDGDIEMSVKDIKNLKNKAGDNVGQAEAEYIRKGVTKTVKGALLKNILAANGIDNEDTVITLNTPDAFETTDRGASYNNITLKQAIEQNYFVAYQEFVDGEWKDIDDTVKGTDIHTNLRMYRNYCDATEGADNQSDWYDECTNITAITLEVPDSTSFKEYPTTGGIRSTWMDKNGTIWVGTYGGGLYSKKAGEDSFTVLNTGSTPALKTDFTSAVAADADGGIWVSQNASYTDPTNNQGVLYIKDGEVKQYRAGTDPATIPNDYVQAIKVDSDGKVWFGSFGGLTIYDPAADTWTTYGKADKEEFPATSINTITLDGKGGAWLGFYPDGSGTAADPYVGGFCHIDKDGNVDKVKKETGDSAPMFAQIWTRSIAIDKKGTVWAISAGTNLEDNVGGVIWKWKDGNAEPDRYTGKEVLGDYLDGSNTTEVRTVAVDKDGSLWFGTSADGILKVDNPKLNGGKMTVSAQYAKETGSWSAANMNNIYSIDFWNDGTAYVGSAGGLLVLGDEPESGGEEPAATPESVTESIDDLYALDTVTSNDREAVEKARRDYESLSDAEKESLPAGTVEKLEAVEAKLVAAEAKDTVESIRELSETIVAAVSGGYTNSKYTAATYTKYEQALTAAQAVIADPNASKADIDAANLALAEAKKALVEKSANTMKAAGKTRTVKAAKVKKAKRKVAAISVKRPVGKVTYKKAGGSAKLTVDSKTGKIIVKKGTKKGKYKIKVKVTASGGDNHKALSKTVKVTIKVK